MKAPIVPIDFIAGNELPLFLGGCLRILDISGKMRSPWLCFEETMRDAEHASNSGVGWDCCCAVCGSRFTVARILMTAGCVKFAAA
jgi:hypothetical protein